MSSIVPLDGTSDTGNALDSVLGTASSALDIWTQWETAKAANTATKAAIPTTAVVPTPATVSSKTLLLYGGIAAGVLVVGALVWRMMK